MDAILSPPHLCVALKTVKSLQFVRCLCDSHTCSNILQRFHILFVVQIHFPPLSSRCRCKTMQVVTSIHREIYLNKRRIFLHFSKQLVTCFLYRFKDCLETLLKLSFYEMCMSLDILNKDLFIKHEQNANYF